MDEIDHLMKYYFHLGFQNLEVRLFLTNHHVQISERQLKRRLNKIKLFRRKNYSTLDDIIDFIYKQVQTSGHLHGYKWMHLRYIQSNLRVKQQTVRPLLKLIDPEGVACRSRRRLQRRQYSNRGPNFM